MPSRPGIRRSSRVAARVGSFVVLWTLAALAGSTTARCETLTLEDCLRETAAHSPLIIEQQIAIEEATATRLTLRARALPTFQVGGLAGYQGKQDSEELKVAQSGKTVVADDRSGKLLAIGTEQLNQPLFDAAIPASWRRGTVGILVAQENFYTVAVSQLYLARTQFYRALYLQQRGEVLDRTDNVLKANVKAQTDLVSAGLRGRQSQLSAEVQRTNFGQLILAATGAYRSDLAALLRTMGREPGAAADDPVLHIKLNGSLDDQPIAFDPAATGKEALENRPDLRLLRAQVRSNAEDANIARAGYYPLVTVYVAGELLPQSFLQKTDPTAVRSSDQVQTSEIRPGIREDWTVIDTGTVRGAVNRIEAIKATIAISLQRLERNIPSELAAVRASMDGSAASLAALRGNVTTAQDTLNTVNAGVTQGVNSQLEFLDAQTGVLITRLGLLDAALELSLARAEFDRITGRYVHYVNDDSHPATARK